MKKKADTSVKKLPLSGDVSCCPACDYTDGFHVSFQLNSDNCTGSIILICPQCSGRFSAGWPIQLEKE